MPNDVVMGTGQLSITPKSVIVCSDELLKPAASMLSADLVHDFGMGVAVSTDASQSAIRFELVPNQYPEEGYELIVSSKEMLVKVSTYKGGSACYTNYPSDGSKKWCQEGCNETDFSYSLLLKMRLTMLGVV